MDEYTRKTKEWLNKRYRTVTDAGIFYAHQNIYGFKSPNVEEGVVLRYLIVSNVVRALKLIKFDSLLDVGGAEGYMSALIRKLFGAKTMSCDLSDEACHRAKEIFDVDATPVDGVDLPFPDNSFDVVLSSETLEHIPDYQSAFRELIRVAKHAVLVTVPHDGEEAVAENIRNNVTHGHLHDFTVDSFSDLVPGSYAIKAWGLSSSWLKLPFRLVEGREVNENSRRGFKRSLVRILNPAIRFLGKILNESAFKFFFSMDHFLSNKFDSYRQVVFLIVKNPQVLILSEMPKIDVSEILAFKVPPFVIKKNRFKLEEIMEPVGAGR